MLLQAHQWVSARACPGEVPGDWLECCRFIKSPGANQEWLINKHGAFKHDRSALVLSALDQTTHFQTWLHLVHAWAPHHGRRKSRGALQLQGTKRAHQGFRLFFLHLAHDEGPMEKVCVVHKYKHLGTWLTSDGSLTIEMKHRAASACGALVALERTVLGQLGDAVSVRSDAGDVTAPFQSTCVDAATQRHCSASHAENACVHCDESRVLAGNRMRQPRPSLTDSEVRRRLGAPSIEYLRNKARLQYLCRERHYFPTLWAIVDKKCGSAQKGMEADTPHHTWVQQLRADMRALWALSPMARQSLPSPEHPGYENSWLNAAEDEKRWRALVGGLRKHI